VATPSPNLAVSKPVDAAARPGGARAWTVGLRWMLLGLALSLPIHGVLLVWLAVTNIDRAGAPRPGEAMIELSVLPEDSGDAETATAATGGDAPQSPEIASSEAPSAPTMNDDPLAGALGEGTGLGEGGAEGFGGFGPGGGGGDGFGGGGGTESGQPGDSSSDTGDPGTGSPVR